MCEIASTQTGMKRHAPLVVTDRQVFDHALRGHLFDDLLRRAFLVHYAQLRPRHDRLARSSQCTHERDVEHAQWAGGKLAHDVGALARLIHWVELDRGELMPITR